MIEFYVNNHRILIQPHYEHGKWFYFLHQLPSDKDIEFANTSTCEDRDLWLDSNLINTDAWDHEYNTIEEALLEAEKHVKEIIRHEEKND